MYTFHRARARPRGMNILYHRRNAIQLATSGIHRVFREIPRVRSFREPCQNSHGTASRISPCLILSFSLVFGRSSLVLAQRSGDREETYSHTPCTPTVAAIIPSTMSRDPIRSPLALAVSVVRCAPPSRLSRVPPFTLSFQRNLSRFFSIVKRSTLVLRTAECC